MMIERPIILASKSPRRYDILKQIGLEFSVMEADVDEDLGNGCIDGALMRLAQRKAGAVRAHAAHGLIIGADTVVLCEGRVLGKPDGERDAYRMLNLLQGRASFVKTGVCVMDAQSGAAFCGLETTAVHFTNMNDADIRAYIQTGEPFGKAGAYAVQGFGARYISRIEGCYYNVVGLPVVLTLGLLERAAGACR